MTHEHTPRPEDALVRTLATVARHVAPTPGQDAIMAACTAVQDALEHARLSAHYPLALLSELDLGTLGRASAAYPAGSAQNAALEALGLLARATWPGSLEAAGTLLDQARRAAERACLLPLAEESGAPLSRGGRARRSGGSAAHGLRLPVRRGR